MCSSDFPKLFRLLRLQAGIGTLAELNKELSLQGIYYDDSILSHWQRGRRLPTSRRVLLALLYIFIKQGIGLSISDANDFLESAGQGYLTKSEQTKLFLLKSLKVTHASR